VFERYTASARRILFLALDEARERGSRSIRTDHLLLGVIHVADDITGPIFRNAGVSIEMLASAVPRSKSPIPPSVEVPFHSATKRVLQYAAEESERLQGALLAANVLADDHIGPEHLLLGLLREDDGTGASILAQRGVTLDIVRRESART
jgi:ATP-dependent Clp protease ATP-binding subunit ClpC